MKATRVASLSGVAFLITAALALGGDVKVDGLVESATGFKFPDGSVQSSAAGSYDKVIVVAKSGGDFTSIQDAINSATGTPTNRYLVRVAPGVYEERVTMKAGVDVEGSGVLTTKITFGGSPMDDTGTVIGATDAELRFLTVESVAGPGTNAIAIYNELASPRLTHVQAVAIAIGGSNTFGVYNRNASPAMTYVFASGAFSAANNYGVYNITTDLLKASSPTMRQVVVAVGTLLPGVTDFYYGVFNTGGSAPVIRDSDISCFRGTKCYGVYNQVGSPAVLHNATVRVSDASAVNVGVFSDTNSETVLQDCRVHALKGAAGSSTAHAIESSMSRPLVHHSILIGDTHPITGSTPSVAYSQLSGPKVNYPAGTCIGAYDENFVLLGSDCDP